MGSTISAAITAGTSIFSAILGHNAEKGNDKTRASVAANAASRAVWEQIVPAYKSGVYTAEQAAQLINDVWSEYETWINSNISDASIAQNSIESQRSTLTEGLAAVGNPAIAVTTPDTAEEGLYTQAGQLASVGSSALTGGIGNVEKASSYYGSILGGGKALEEATSTSINDINKQYESAIRKMSRGAARSGATAQTAANSATSLLSEANKLKTNAKSTAAEQLGSLGSKEAALGLTSASQGASDWSTILSDELAASKLASDSSGSSNSNSSGSSAGSALSTLLNAILGDSSSS